MNAMADTVPSLQSAERLYARAIDALAPFFSNMAADADSARSAAQNLLATYTFATPRELQLVTQVAALNCASVACMGAASVAARESLDAMLALQTTALALNTQSYECTKALDSVRRSRRRNPAGMKAEKILWDEGEFQLVINRALDKMNEASERIGRGQANTPPAAPAALARKPVLQRTNFAILDAERMTPAVLARRARH